MLLAYGHFDAVLGVGEDDLEVLIIRLKQIFMLVISVEADVQNFSVFVWRHLNLEVQHAGLVKIILPFSKVDVSYQVLWLVDLRLDRLILRVSKRTQTSFTASEWPSRGSL